MRGQDVILQVRPGEVGSGGWSRLFQPRSRQDKLRLQQNAPSDRSQENVLNHVTTEPRSANEQQDERNRQRMATFHELARSRQTFPARGGSGLSRHWSLGADELQRNPDAKRKSSAPGFEDCWRDLPAAESASAVARSPNQCQPGQFPGLCDLEPAANRSGVFRLGSLRRAHHP